LPRPAPGRLAPLHAAAGAGGAGARGAGGPRLRHPRRPAGPGRPGAGAPAAAQRGGAGAAAAARAGGDGAHQARTGAGDPGGVRAGLRALTARGRSFLASGTAALLMAYLLGENDLFRIGVLVVALPLLAAMVVARTRYRLSCARRLDPARAEAGGEARVTLRLENVTKLPTGLLLIEDTVPYALGVRPRFVLDRVEGRGIREIDYKVRSDLRGRFPIGPLSIRIADPFGLVELTRSFT